MTLENIESQPEIIKDSQKKQIFWDETLKGLNRVSDRLGKPIDPGIKETVTAFMVNEFPTCGSCEGHVEERFGKTVKLSPYIEIEIEMPSQRFVGEMEIKSKIASKYGIKPEEIDENDAADKEFWDYIHQYDVPETPEFVTARQSNGKFEKLVAQLLEEFYLGRQTNQRKLNIYKIGPTGQFRVTSSTKSYEEINKENIEMCQKELSEEQLEITDFGRFLKERYFAQKSE